jgi:protein-L-isoaspartate(D-aspartate) O-methyltransferase
MFRQLLNRMLKEQIEARGIEDKNVLEAMRRVPRHEFVREADVEHAYDDTPLPIGEGQTISQPYIVGYMTQELEVKPGMKVLEIGTGSGYQAAILSELGAAVYSVERIESLSQKAAQRLAGLGIKDVHLKIGDGTPGWPEHAPYDRIILTGAIQGVPETVEEQLNKKDGILLAPAGEQMFQRLVKIIYRNGRKTIEEKIGVVFVPLYGRFGF